MLRRRGRAGAPDLLGVPGYTDAEVVAVGGSSTVWRARESALARTVAVKVLALPVLDDRLRRRFERELAVAGQLSGHPHVVTTYASGYTADGRPYVTSEWCPGGSLASRVAELGPRPPDEVLRTGSRVAGALAAAHEAGIVHRDVKPQNVLVTAYGEPALADFGIAVVVADGTAATDAMTPVHAAPEVLQGGSATPAADVWGLGSTLWTLLTGAPPYQPRPGEGVLTAMVRVLEEPLPPLPAGTPAPLADVLHRLLDKDPARRPAAADVPALLQEVERALELAPTVAPTPLPPAPGARQAGVVQEAPTHLRPDRVLPPPVEPRRHRRWPWVAAGTVLAAVVGVTAVGAVVGDEPRPAPSPPVTAAPSAAPSQAPQPPQAVQVVADRGDAVELAWTDPNGGALPYVVDPGDGGVLQPAARPDGTTVTGLDPALPYCFSVGTVFRAGAQPLYVEPVCVRGGRPS